ncbi:MAG: Crp/Fnr family transcriptional regulator [Pseudomonadota bacterium]
MKTAAPILPPALAELLPASLHGLCETVTLGKGNYLFRAGRKPVGMYFVVSGELTLERPGAQGEAVILQRMRQGFAAEASLQSPTYHCDAKAVADTTIVRVPIRQLRVLLEQDTAFALRWIGMLNRELKRLRLQCERLSLNTVQDRLLHLIETEGKNGRYPLSSGLKSLARELGVTHEALYRCVASLEKGGKLQRVGGDLLLADIRRYPG